MKEIVCEKKTCTLDGTLLIGIKKTQKNKTETYAAFASLSVVLTRLHLVQTNIKIICLTNSQKKDIKVSEYYVPCMKQGTSHWRWMAKSLCFIQKGRGLSTDPKSLSKNGENSLSPVEKDFCARAVSHWRQNGGTWTNYFCELMRDFSLKVSVL